jgi:hypothetical protein
MTVPVGSNGAIPTSAAQSDTRRTARVPTAPLDDLREKIYYTGTQIS